MQVIPVFDLIPLVSSPRPDVFSVSKLFANSLTDVANNQSVLNEKWISPAERQTANIIRPKQIKQAEAEAVAAAEKAKRDELFSIMDEKLGANAEYTALKENTEITYAELETKCYALVGRQSAEFSYVPTTNNRGTVRFGVGGTQNGSDAAYGGLMEHYLGK